CLSPLFLRPSSSLLHLFFFFSTAPPTPHIYTLSLHDALPIFTWAFIRPPGAGTPPVASSSGSRASRARARAPSPRRCANASQARDRKSTRLNSSHEWISYAVFCLKKKKNI